MPFRRILLGLLSLASGFTTAAIGWAAFMISRFEPGDLVLSNEPGDGAPEQLGSRIVVFCHYDRRGRIHDHTRAYIEALHTERLDIVFVTNSEQLTLADLAWIRGRAARVIVRRNLGYDFAAWRDAMRACGLPSARTCFLLLANDSVYGPLHHLGPVLGRINFDQADVWGATDSWQHSFHLQSFFVAFGPKALGHEVFARFWNSVRNVRSKWWVVRRYEVGLSRAFMAEGLRCKALWPYAEMIKALRDAMPGHHLDAKRPDEICETRGSPVRNEFSNWHDPFIEAGWRNTRRILRLALRRVPLNPTADLWRVLIRQGCPFLKRELLRDNPSKVPDIADWTSAVGEVGSFDRDVILRDLERSLKNRTP